MLKVKGRPIITPIYDILTQLKAQLMLNGLERFHTIRMGPSDIQISCPFHKGGLESKPSSGVTLVDKKIGNKVIPAGTFNCFTCHETMHITEMISKCFGYDDMGRFGSSWIIKNFLSVAIEDRKELEKLPTDRKIKRTEQYFVPDLELDTYRYTHPYMYKRKLTDAIIEKFDVGYDEKTDCLTFPVWDKKGVCVFVARRSVVSKFFNYPKEVDKPLYALNFITSDVSEVIVCESIINALTCWAYGKPAIALIGTGSFTQYDILKKTRIRKYILALDPDEAGAKGTKRFRENVTNKIITEYIIPSGKDINDLTLEEFESLEEVY